MIAPTFELILEGESMEAPPRKLTRFASIDDAGMDELDRKRVPDSTRQTTDKWLRIANDYFAEKRIVCDFATIGKEELSKLLRQMYVELRQRNGNVYSKASLLGFRSAIHRHLAHDLKRRVDIFRQPVHQTFEVLCNL